MIFHLILRPSPAESGAKVVSELVQRFGRDLLVLAQQEQFALWPHAALEVAFMHHIGQLNLAGHLSSLPEAIIQAAIHQQIKLGTAESCTGGLAASLLTDVAGSSAVMQGGVVSYSNDVKMNVLGVTASTLAEYGAVSIPVAQAMATGAAKALKADLVVSFSGIAGPGGGSAEKPVGTVALGTAWRGNASAKLYHFTGDRRSLKQQFAMQGLLKVWAILNDLDEAN